MTVALLLSLTAVLCALAGWGAVRHRATLAWSRELEAAFHTDERRPLPRHRLG